MQTGTSYATAADPKSQGNRRYLTEEEIAEIAKAAADAATEAATKKIADIIEKKLATMEKKLNKCEQKCQDLNSLQQKASSEIEQLKGEVKTLRGEMKSQEFKINDLEQYSRRSHLRIRGLRMTKGEDCKKHVARVCTEELQVPVRVEDLDAAHPLPLPLSAKNATNNQRLKLPQVIVRFHARDLRDRVIRARKHLRGKNIVISEDLTAQNQRLLTQLRKNEEITDCWSWHGKIFGINRNEQRPRQYRSLEDIPQQTRGTSCTYLKQQQTSSK